MSWVEVVDADEVPAHQPILVEIEGKKLTLVKIEGDEILVVDDCCTHQDASLSEGMVFEDEIECPRHGAEFNLRTGEALSLPATQPVGTYRTKIEEGKVLVEWKPNTDE